MPGNYGPETSEPFKRNFVFGVLQEKWLNNCRRNFGSFLFYMEQKSNFNDFLEIKMYILLNMDSI